MLFNNILSRKTRIHSRAKTARKGRESVRTKQGNRVRAGDVSSLNEPAQTSHNACAQMRTQSLCAKHPNRLKKSLHATMSHITHDATPQSSTHLCIEALWGTSTVFIESLCRQNTFEPLTPTTKPTSFSLKKRITT